MQLFYLPNLSIEDKIADFNKDESKHLYKVLRKSPGDKINITNGKNVLFKGTISSISKNNCQVSIQETIKQKPLPYSLHIGISLLKSNERFEWFLEKASEIGVTEITPLICDRTEKKFINENRLKKILISGMKQSIKTHFPKLNAVCSLKNFLKGELNDQLFIAHCNDSEKKPLLKLIKPKSDYLILIGPEGDFTKKELELAINKGFLSIRIGPRILRTETAPISILSILQYKYGDIV